MPLLPKQKPIFFYVRFVLYGFLLLAATECGCKKLVQDPPAPAPEGDLKKSPAPQVGIWHTGNLDTELKPTPPEGSLVPHLYNHTFQFYRVKHDGSCGFRSFIPILLGGILKDNQWQTWIANMKANFYEPAQAILRTLNLAGSRYEQFRTTDDPDQLLLNTQNLLQKLSQEPQARPLQEPEIKLLVDFLRQTVLMKHIINANKVTEALKKRDSGSRATVVQEIDNFFQGANREQQNFWAHEDDFVKIYKPYIILFEIANPLSYYIHYYTITNSHYPYFEDPNQFSNFELFPKQAPPIYLYHHDHAFYEYIVVKDPK